MTPIQVAQLMDAVAQLVLLVQDLKAGVITDSQAWTESKVKFDEAVVKWDGATSKQLLLPLPMADTTKADLTITGQPVTYIPKAL